jgi:hypothetical protein
VKNYELGFKSRFNEGAVTFNASAFYTDIDGLQVIADAGTCSSRIILNAQAETIGGEMELFVRPTEAWDLGLSATYVQAEITETQLNTPIPPAQPTPIAGIRDGNRLPTSPELQAAATVGYTWRAVHHDADPVRCRAAFVRDRQSSLGHSRRPLGGRALRQQSLGRTRIPVDRPRARPQRARGLPDQPAAHVRRELPHEFLRRQVRPGQTTEPGLKMGRWWSGTVSWKWGLTPFTGGRPARRARSCCSSRDSIRQARARSAARASRRAP